MTFTNSCDGYYKDSLDVRFTKMCDNNCPFCIEKGGITGKSTNVPAMIEATKASGKSTVLILGGEPFLLLPELKKYIEGIYLFVKEIYITTSLPITIQENIDLFCEIADMVTGINISFQHYDDEKNNEIMHASRHYKRTETLKKLCDMGYADKFRVSINLVKGSIDTVEKIESFLWTMENLGVKHVKINELQHANDLYISFEKAYGIELPSPFSHGCQDTISLPGHDLRITLKRACFCVNDGLKATLPDLCKAIIKQTTKKYCGYQIVLYEDGTLSDGWKKEKLGA